MTLSKNTIHWSLAIGMAGAALAIAGCHENERDVYYRRERVVAPREVVVERRYEEPRPYSDTPRPYADTPRPYTDAPRPVVEEAPIEPAYEPAPAEAVVAYEPDLNPHGEWITVREYGRCWVPRGRPAGWRPYTVGHWVNTSDGWSWYAEGDEAEWGVVTYHYGRWHEEPSRGWIWVPGTTWAPAWVSWREGGGYSGWAPLGPRVGYRRQIDAVYVDRYVPAERYTFVESRYVGEPRIHSHIVQNNVTIVNKTTNITNITVVNNRVVNRGVTVETVERASGKRYEQTRVTEVSSATEARRLHAQGQPVAFVPDSVKKADVGYRERVERRNEEADKAEHDRGARREKEAAAAKLAEHGRVVNRNEAAVAADKAEHDRAVRRAEEEAKAQKDRVGRRAADDTAAKAAEHDRVVRREQELKAADLAKQQEHERALRRAQEDAAAKAAADKAAADKARLKTSVKTPPVVVPDTDKQAAHDRAVRRAAEEAAADKAAADKARLKTPVKTPPVVVPETDKQAAHDRAVRRAAEEAAAKDAADKAAADKAKPKTSVKTPPVDKGAAVITDKQAEHDRAVRRAAEEAAAKAAADKAAADKAAGGKGKGKVPVDPNDPNYKAPK